MDDMDETDGMHEMDNRPARRGAAASPFQKRAREETGAGSQNRPAGAAGYM